MTLNETQLAPLKAAIIADPNLAAARAVKGVGSGEPSEVCWLVAELDGVRVYQQGNHVIVTREEMYP